MKQDVVDLDPEVLVTLDKIAEILSRYPSKFIEIQGHTDSQPLINLPFQDNWGLAAARAEKVVRYLANHTPLEAKRLKGSSCSQYRPLPAELASKNSKMRRRVEIVLAPRRREAVHAYDKFTGSVFAAADRLHNLRARFFLRLRRDRVLEIENHDIGFEGLGLFQCPGVRARHVKRTSARAQSHLPDLLMSVRDPVSVSRNRSFHHVEPS